MAVIHFVRPHVSRSASGTMLDAPPAHVRFDASEARTRDVGDEGLAVDENEHGSG